MAIATQPTDASVAQFLDSATPERRRQDGHALHALMTEVTGDDGTMWGPSIVGYGTYHYVSSRSSQEGDWMKVGFSPRKAQLSLYGLKDTPAGAALLLSLGTYTEGAGCVYVKKLADVDMDVLRQLVAIAFARDNAQVTP